MRMSNHSYQNRLARHPGNQGARPSGGNQPEIEKLATGKTNGKHNNFAAKRLRREVSSSEEDFPMLPSQDEAPWPQFLIVEAREGSLRGVSSVRVSVQLDQILHEYDCKRERTGALNIKVSNKADSDKLLKCTELFGRDVEVKPHGFLNTCKGVIRSFESVNCSDEELTEWFHNHNIESYYRLPKHHNSESESLVLVFQGRKLPEIARVGFERCRVRPYIPNPRRCFRCQRYGHISKFCTHPEACAKCGSPDHAHTKDAPCEDNPSCVNCGHNHASFDRTCPRFRIEKEAQRLRTTQGISLTQALKLAEKSAGHTVTYASIATLSESPGMAAGPPAPVCTTPKRSLHVSSFPDYSPGDGPRMSPRSAPRKRLQLESGTVFSKYKKSKMPSNEDLSDESAAETARLNTPIEQVQANQNSSFEDVSADNVEKINQSNPLEEVEMKEGKTDIDMGNENTTNGDIEADTYYELLQAFLKYNIVVGAPTRQILVRDFLDPTIKILQSHGMNRGAINLKSRTTMPLENVPKEKYRTKEDVSFALRSCGLNEYEYGILCLLCFHECYTIAISMVKKFKDEIVNSDKRL